MFPVSQAPFHMIAYYWCFPKEDDLTWEARLQCLPLVVQQHILQRQRLQRRIDSTYGYWLLQHGLMDRFGVDLDALFFAPSGKPLLRHANIQFSMSHSSGVVGIAISERGRIGLDIQAQKQIDVKTASPIFFSYIEQEAIAAAPYPAACLFQYWSKKEALVKAFGGSLFELAHKTDVRAPSTVFEGLVFHWLNLPHPTQGTVWLASEVPFDNFFARKWSFH